MINLSIVETLFGMLSLGVFMVISFFFKVLLLYVLYLFFKGVFRTYSTIKVFKNQTQPYSAEERATRPTSSQGQGDVFEAEYTVLNEDEATKS